MKALLVIDVQNGLTKKKTLFNESVFFQTINEMIKTFYSKNHTIIFFQHNNKNLIHGSYDWEIDDRLKRHKSDKLLKKMHGNAFHKTDLKRLLQHKNICEITVCGLVSQGCVKATCVGGLEEGFQVNLLQNGHTNWNRDAQQKINSTDLELQKEGVNIIPMN